MARHSRKRSAKDRRSRAARRDRDLAPATSAAGEASEPAKATGPQAREPRPARARRPSAEDRPPPLWGAFPLTELVTLAGIVLMVWGFLSDPGENANRKITAGLAIASLAGLELSIREHVTGFRSHTTLLSAAMAAFAMVGLVLGAGLETLGPLVLAGLGVFVLAFLGLRELFKRRSGGLSFR